MFSVDRIEKAQQIIWNNQEMKLTIVSTFGRQPNENSQERFSGVFPYTVNTKYQNDDGSSGLDGFSFFNNTSFLLERKMSAADKKRMNFKEFPQVRFDPIDSIMMINSLRTVNSWLQDQSDSIFTKDGTGRVTSIVHVAESFRTRSGRMITMMPEIITDEMNSEVTYEGIGLITDDVGRLGSMSPMEFLSFKTIFEAYTPTMVAQGNQLFMMAMIYGLFNNSQNTRR
jgi:hypothetical protein